MAEQFKEKYLSTDRIINDKIIKSVQQYISNKCELFFSSEDISNGSFVNSEQFKSLENETKRQIIIELNSFNYSFIHVLLCHIKNLIEAKEKYKDESWYRYDVDNFVRTGLINKFDYDENGKITINSIIGTFSFSSLYDVFKKDKDLDSIIRINQYQAMCFSNAISVLESKKTGSIMLIQICEAQKKYLHAIYLNNNTIYDLNYYIAYSYEQLNKLYNFQIIKSLDYDLWMKIKHEYFYLKPESLLVSFCISDQMDDVQQMIHILDQNDNFSSRRPRAL